MGIVVSDRTWCSFCRFSFALFSPLSHCNALSLLDETTTTRFSILPWHQWLQPKQEKYMGIKYPSQDGKPQANATTTGHCNGLWLLRQPVVCMLDCGQCVRLWLVLVKQGLFRAREQVCSRFAGGSQTDFCVLCIFCSNKV